MPIEDAFLAALLGSLVVFSALFLRSVRKHRAGGEGRRRAWLFAGNVALFLALASAAALWGEVYYRFLYDQSDSFNLTRTATNWFGRHYFFNSWGFRDSVDYSLEPPPAKRRITFIGDSFTVGHGVADVSERFANRIRAARERWDVHVLGQNGLDSIDQLDLVMQTPLAYLFDTVVLVYTLNDIALITPQWEEVYDDIYLEKPSHLFARSYLLNTLYFRRQRTHHPGISSFFAFTKSAYEDPTVWGKQRELLMRIKRVVEGRGGRLLAVTFPFVHSLGPAYEFRGVHRQLAEFWASQGVPHLDLLGALEQHAGETLTANKYDAHPNERAHAIAAQAIMSFLDREVTPAIWPAD